MCVLPTGVKVCRLIAVGLGLMCVIQAALNISLRLAHCEYLNMLLLPALHFTSEKQKNVSEITLAVTSSYDDLTRRLRNTSAHIFIKVHTVITPSYFLLLKNLRI